MTKRQKIVRGLLLTFAIIIPLVVGALIFQYGYKRYKRGVLEYDYIYQYLRGKEAAKDETKANSTETQIEHYVHFFAEEYTKLPLQAEEVIHDGKSLFKFRVYSGIFTAAEDTDPGEGVKVEQFRRLEYLFFIYDVNYTNLMQVKAPGNPNVYYGVLPKLTITIKDEQNVDNKMTRPVDIITDYRYPETTITIVDQNILPKEDTDGKSMTTLNIKAARFALNPDKQNPDFLSNGLVSINFSEEGSEALHSFKLEDFVQNPEDYRKKVGTANGADNKIEKIGYAKTVIGKYLWWQTALAVILTGVVTVGFYISWTVPTQNDVASKKPKGKKK